MRFGDAERESFGLASKFNRNGIAVRNPKGVVAQSPRLLYSATLGRRIALLLNPNGVVALVLQGRSTTNVAPLCKSIRQDATPSGLGPMTKEVLGSTPSPRVAE